MHVPPPMLANGSGVVQPPGTVGVGVGVSCGLPLVPDEPTPAGVVKTKSADVPSMPTPFHELTRK
jgi:hypothetical protein